VHRDQDKRVQKGFEFHAQHGRGAQGTSNGFSGAFDFASQFQDPDSTPSSAQPAGVCLETTPGAPRF